MPPVSCLPLPLKQMNISQDVGHEIRYNKAGFIDFIVICIETGVSLI